MTDAARLAANDFSQKPAGTPYSKYRPGVVTIAGIRSCIDRSIVDTAFSAAISYSEALSNISSGSISWSIVKLYYSCFYSLKAAMFCNEVVPFNSGAEMILDLRQAQFRKGGRSSHHWNWDGLEKITSINSKWYISEDSRDAYNALRTHRENVNYTHGFTDPELHRCLISEEPDLNKRVRTYRDDTPFNYTYLENHLAVAYPTRLIFDLEVELNTKNLNLSSAQQDRLRKVWPMKDRCPFT